MPDEINPIQWDALQLDPYNPRLPEKLQGSDEEQIFSFLVENENAIELAQSMVETGFFQHEPLLVAPKANDKHIVLEGNRRLTALMLIHNALPQVATAESLGLSVTQDQRARLLQIPCLEISDPNSIKAYVGYRHVSGVKPWSPEAKARFVVAEVDRHHVLGTPDPFKEVGRAIGSNALGVRNSYVALRSLVVARETFGVSVDFVLLHRFGVWMRCLNVPGVLKHIGLVEIPKKYEDVQPALEGMAPAGLKDVIGDLTEEDHRAAILRDSRQASDYGKVLQNEVAHKTLKSTRQIELAILAIGNDVTLPVRIEQLADQCQVLTPEVEKAKPTARLKDAVELLALRARAMKLSIEAKA